MTSSSHLAGSSLVYLLGCAVLESEPSIQGVAITAIGSLLPDIDLPTSAIGRPFFPIAGWINRKIGHRTLTHSLVGLVIFGALAFGTAWSLAFWMGAPVYAYALLLALGYSAHILVDTLNKTGVDLFWPGRVKAVFFGNEKYRIVSAGSGDYWFMTVCLLANLGLYPVARDGFTFSLHRAFGDIYSVSMDYKQYGDKNRIWIDLEGVEVLSNRKVKGRFEILAALDNGAVLIERDGVKQVVSRTPPHHLYPDRAKIVIGEPVSIQTAQIDMAGHTLGEVPRFPGAARVLYYGHLTPVKQTPLSVHQDRYDPLALRLEKLRLEHAEYEDIRRQNAETIVIREGMLVARILRAGVQPDANPVVPAPKEGVRQVELRLKPTDQILIKEGDLVEFGQVIARQDVSVALSKLDLDLRVDLDRLEDQIAETEQQLAVIEQDLDRALLNSRRLTERSTQVRNQPLLAKEAARIEQTQARQDDEIRALSVSRDTLKARRGDLRARVPVVLEQAESRRWQIEDQADVRAGFEGTIDRLQREAGASDCILRITYRSGLRNQLTACKITTKW